jgi:hypothetical protein
VSDCCNHNCNEGRACPERIAHKRWLSEQDMGVECALPIELLGQEPREPRPWRKYALIVAVCVIWSAILIYGR